MPCSEVSLQLAGVDVHQIVPVASSPAHAACLLLFVACRSRTSDLLEIELISYRVKKIDLMYTVSAAH